jgi:NAD-dependent SIR2 family protein deacetylase
MSENKQLEIYECERCGTAYEVDEGEASIDEGLCPDCAEAEEWEFIIEFLDTIEVQKKIDTFVKMAGGGKV